VSTHCKVIVVQLLFAGCLCMFSARVPATDLEIEGGLGGGYFRQECGPGEYLVGFNGRTGAWLDAIQIVCAGRANNLWSLGDAVLRGNQAGRNGGSPNSVRCPSTNQGATVVTAIVFGITVSNGKPSTVGGIEVTCSYFQPPFVALPAGVQMAASGDNDELDAGFLQGTNPRVRGSSYCPAGEVAVGLHGRSGDFIDALGLICAVPSPPPSPLSFANRMRAGAAAAQVLATTAAPPRKKILGTVRLPGQSSSPAPPSQPSAPQPPKLSAFPAGAAPPSIFYSVSASGALNWYRSSGEEGGARQFLGPRVVAPSKWNAFAQVIPAGGRFLYGLTSAGDILKYEHIGFESGDAVWKGPLKLTAKLPSFVYAFGAGGGIIYFTTADGNLHWARNPGYSGNDPSSWVADRVVATGWGSFRHPYWAGSGVIYAVSANGDLIRFRHRDFEAGGTTWDPPMAVTGGATSLVQPFSTYYGMSFALSASGDLLYFRQLTWDLDVPDQQLFGPIVVASGLNPAEPIFPLLP
jgi:hypothetical protein